MKDFFINNWDKIVFILPFLFGIYQFFQTQRRQVEIEKLKTQLELEKSQKLLNDNKFRGAYEKYINLMFELLNKDKPLGKIENGVVDFMKTAILFGGPATIRSFGLYRKESGSGNEKDVALYMENLISSMREDLGVSNSGLKEYDILQTFIVGDVKKEFNK